MCRQKVRRLETAGCPTFHRGRRRARGGERVNSGEGPFARLVKGLDAERVRGRLIKPLDFVCVAWSFIQGYKSVMGKTRDYNVKTGEDATRKRTPRFIRREI